MSTGAKVQASKNSIQGKYCRTGQRVDRQMRSRHKRELAGAVWFLYWGHVQPGHSHLSGSPEPPKAGGGREEVQRAPCPGLGPSPVLVLAEGLCSGE